MSIKPNSPIFAPIPYGDDRQVGRTRRGLNCPAELRMNPNIVYIHCLSCGYDWYMNKSNYSSGTGMEGMTPQQLLKYKNVGIGGTGYKELYTQEYSSYDRYLYDCCTGGAGACGSAGEIIEFTDFYPYTGCTGGTGELTGGTGEDGLLIYGTGGSGDSPCLGDATTFYKTCVGKSGSAPIDEVQYFTGAYPTICPNCCRVNFEAYWVEIDNPRPDPDTLTNPKPPSGYQHPKLCTMTLVRDLQRIKSHYDLGVIPNSSGVNPQQGIHTLLSYDFMYQEDCSDD